ncbi:MAG TPA: FAD/NAD(P)-binding oxidoreductase [Acidimicrobiia bacterium]|nr:FAD/NAD(P)-binding oxidoreductase [Acidimicrobiia bacterium]
MNRLLVLGAGTAGTMVVNKLRPLLPREQWAITVVDQDSAHHYQPGYLFVPFDPARAGDVVKPRRKFLTGDVDLILGQIDQILPDDNVVRLSDGSELGYDFLVIATGVSPRPDQTPGMLGGEWRKSIFDFYTLEGATALGEKLRTWDGGRLVVHITEMPIKCPPAPLEFTFLADAFFKERGMRDRVEITFVTPLDGAFTKPVASNLLGGMLEKRGITLEPDFYIERVDDETKKIVSYDEREIPFDLLVTVPLNMGADFIARSGMGNELNCVPVDKHTFVSPKWDNVFALGDAADLPTSKAGSVAHFAVEIFTENFLRHIAGKTMTGQFDGHANCFVESGAGRAMLIDFNYDVQPLPGKYPVPGLGPMSLLAENRVNHWGKLLFRWIYWHILLPGRRLPVPTLMSMAGKRDVEPMAMSPTEKESVQ